MNKNLEYKNILYQKKKIYIKTFRQKNKNIKTIRQKNKNINKI
jgi:hypothetical protein